MKTDILLLGPGLPQLIDISLQLDGNTYATAAVQTLRPLEHLLGAHSRSPEGAVIRLTGHENVAGFETLFATYPGCGFVFLEPEFPPHAAIARVVGQHGGAILRATEAPIVIAATLVSLMFQRQRATA